MVVQVNMMNRANQTKLAEKLYILVNEKMGENVWDELMADAEHCWIGATHSHELKFRRNWLSRLGENAYKVFINLYSNGIFG